jgi:6-phospho-3-hexuloisomerase
MQMTSYTESIMNELQRTVARIDDQSVGLLAGRIVQADQIFVAGAGRSGLMMRAFAMRLMHIGLRAYVVGETVTPGLTAQDLLIIGSGSGETKSLAVMAEKAAKAGAPVALATIVPESTIGRLSEIVIRVPAATKEAADGGATTIQPMGSLFEQSLLLLFDALILQLMDLTGNNTSTMFGRHANLE